jgi:hypothetical protein
MGTILLAILIILLLVGLPAWPYSRDWGYGPSGMVTLLIMALLLLLLMDVISWGVAGPMTAIP